MKELIIMLAETGDRAMVETAKQFLREYGIDWNEHWWALKKIYGSNEEDEKDIVIHIVKYFL